ncbi:hypothetical protein TRFO_11947 [Tritrichomonas foetus]|uniref:Uncharacterized protein n=1 Tax=Tritrichomonas foetus TaxID=1144522 RepID=A0A1J4J1N6_9EUKA|nr:hypothetical protein TRFO_11947 [Tritrichomonas foetus]|eukprot:OHS93314.1 hypothetical protein TRFO_11947 [Tritrichomonas foetus]
MNDVIITNGINDNWFDGCHAIATKVFQPIFSSFQFIIHFDAMIWIVAELLLLLPIFFRLYGFGVQQKLARFYNTARYQLIHFLYLFSLSAVLCSLLQLCLPQPPACVTWDGLNYHPLRNNYLSPSFTIVLITILSSFLFSVTIGVWNISRVVATIFFISITLSAIFSGTATVNQALLSIALGFWLFTTYSFLPPIFIPAGAAIVVIFSMTIFLMRIIQKGRFETMVQLCVVPGIRGCILLIIVCYLYFKFSRTQDSFDWFAVHWGKTGDSSSSSAGDAVVPEVVNVGSGDVFGQRLKMDIIDSAIAFVAVLSINEFVTEYFKYEMFSST